MKVEAVPAAQDKFTRNYDRLMGYYYACPNCDGRYVSCECVEEHMLNCEVTPDKDTPKILTYSSLHPLADSTTFSVQVEPSGPSYNPDDVQVKREIFDLAHCDDNQFGKNGLFENPAPPRVLEKKGRRRGRPVNLAGFGRYEPYVNDPSNGDLSNGPPYRCRFCHREFPFPSTRRMHERTHTGEKPYVCRICGKSFALSSTLYNHRLTHGEQPTLPCGYPGCKSMFKNRVTRWQHRKTHGQGTWNYPREFYDDGVPVPRKIIRSIFHGDGKAKDTNNLSNNGIPDGANNGSSGAFRRRPKKSASNNGSKADARRRFKCDICGNAFNHKSTLNDHKKTHSDIPQYKCDFPGCGLIFWNRTTRWKHGKDVHGDSLIVARNEPRNYLNAKNNSKNDVGATLTPAPPIIVPTPSENLTAKAVTNVTVNPAPAHRRKRGRPRKTEPPLDQPILTESGYRYMCDVCGSGFRQRYNLTIHMRTHTGEKPYTCGICGKSFAQTCTLTDHMLTHSSTRELRCDYPGCDAVFRNRVSRWTHQAIHRLEPTAPYLPGLGHTVGVEEEVNGNDVILID